jgi:sugar/nucleoside kinase (ribokinase family)
LNTQIPEEKSADTPRARACVLCAGIAVEDYIFRVDRFPTPGTKSAAEDFVITGGGCAANAAIAIARLGGEARFAGPLGDDPASERVVQGMAGAGVNVSAVKRVPGGRASISGIFIDSAGERLLVTRRSHGLRTVCPDDPEALVTNRIAVVLADNHFPEFARPICEEARRRGIPVVLDIDRALEPGDPVLALGTHPVFSAEALRSTWGCSDLEAALARAFEHCRGFVAATDGANGTLWRNSAVLQHQRAFAVAAVDTLAAGDVFHGAFALALAEDASVPEALRFASAAAALKCTRFGGIAGTPSRAAVNALIASPDRSPS